MALKKRAQKIIAKNNFARLCRRLTSESGQAVIEYILIIVVVIGIIFGGLYQLNQAFRSWADNYFGEYLACLLETGELPALGGPAGECNQSFKPFSIADGRPLIDSQGGSGSTSAETGSFRMGQPPAPGSNSSGNYGGGGSSYVQKLPASGGWGSSTRSRIRLETGGGGAGEGDGSGSQTGSAQITELNGGQGGKIVRIPLRDSGLPTGWGSRIKDKDENKERFKANGPVVVAGGGAENTQRLIPIQRKISSTEKVEDEEFTFGKFIRYLVIIGIIIAIVIFIGGQLLQVSKSME